MPCFIGNGNSETFSSSIPWHKTLRYDVVDERVFIQKVEMLCIPLCLGKQDTAQREEDITCRNAMSNNMMNVGDAIR